MKKVPLILLFAILSLQLTHAFALETSQCHCFRNRTYNPAEKFSSDEYLLTTTFNSLIASSFSIAKRQIVMLKMKGGVKNEDLLIGLYVNRKTGNDVGQLLEMRNKKSWQQILSEILPESSHKEKVYNFILNGASQSEAADEITVEMLSFRFNVERKKIDAIARNGESLRQAAVAFTLAEYVQTDPENILQLYREKKYSWSEIAHNFGLQPSDLGDLAEKGNNAKK